MFEIRAFLYLQFPDDTVCKHLSQFDTPLVEGVDVPYAALGEDLVLVEGDEPMIWPRMFGVSFGARIEFEGRFP